MNRLSKVWKNRWQIWEGVKNSLVHKPYIESIAEARKIICERNECGYYDAKGAAENCSIKGSACCSACGCKLAWKQRSLSSSCGLTEVGKYPLWQAHMTEQEEKRFREKTGIKND